LRATGQTPSEIEHVEKSATVREVIAEFARTSARVLPVVGAKPPLMIGEVAGAVTQDELLQIIAADADALESKISEHVGDPMPLVGSHEPVERARETVAERGAVMVLEAGRPIGVLTAVDLLTAR